MQTQNELKDATNKAKSELASFAKWYENDAQNEKLAIQNFTKQSYDRAKINLIIKQNLTDTKKIIENIDFLTRFPTTLYIGYNDNEAEFLKTALKITFEKFNLHNEIFTKEMNIGLKPLFYCA